MEIELRELDPVIKKSMNMRNFIANFIIASSFLYGFAFADGDINIDKDFKEFMEKMDIVNERNRLVDYYRNREEAGIQGSLVIRADEVIKISDSSTNFFGDVSVTITSWKVFVDANSIIEKSGERILEGNVQIKFADKILTTDKAIIKSNGKTVIKTDRATISLL